MKIFFRSIHLYLSLAAGLVILIACVTGAILVFEKDLQMALRSERYFVEAGINRMPLDLLADKVKDSFPGAKVNSVRLYADRERSAEINISLAAEGGGLTKKPAGRQPGYTIFIDPYTGAILDKYSYRETWFYTVFSLHRWLLGGQGSAGKYIVGISTLIFLFILITGFILWWPKTRKILKQRVRIKWTAGWKRLNHDLHIVFGFYSAIFLFIIAFTGLAWSFEWFNKGIYKVTNSPMRSSKTYSSTYVAGAERLSLEQALATAKTVYGDAQFYSISMPRDSAAAISVTALSKDPVHESATDAVYIDQYSGKTVGTMTFGERSLGDRVRSSFKPVHTGSIWGTPSKIIAFIVCLFGASFPITGVVMWINRLRKKKKKYARTGLPLAKAEEAVEA